MRVMTYSAVELGTSLGAVLLGSLLSLRGTAGNLALDLGGKLVCVGYSVNHPLACVTFKPAGGSEALLLPLLAIGWDYSPSACF